MRHDVLMSRDWERLATAVRTQRKRLGMTQAELAVAAAVSESTVQNLEAGNYSTRMPRTMPKVEAALGWQPGSGRAVLSGGDPDLAPEDGAASPSEAAAGSAPAGDLPQRIIQEISEGLLLDATVLDLSPLGSDARMIVVLRGAPDASPEQIRADLLAWERAQQRIKGVDVDDDVHEA